MAETDSRPQSESASETGAKTRGKAEPPADGAAARERRSFADTGQAVGRAANQAADEARGAAQASLKAGRDIASAGQDAARRAGGQAAELWRASLDPLANMQNEFSRWFEQTWRQSLSGRLQGESLFSAFTGGPMADMYESEDAIELHIDLPGLTTQDVQLSVKGSALTVCGQRSETTAREDGGYRVRERRSGRFERTFQLPEDADRSRIEARFADGVLRVTIPRLAGSELNVERIPIQG